MSKTTLSADEEYDPDADEDYDPDATFPYVLQSDDDEDNILGGNSNETENDAVEIMSESEEVVESRELWTYVCHANREPAPYANSQIGADNVEEIKSQVESGGVIGTQLQVNLPPNGPTKIC